MSDVLGKFFDGMSGEEKKAIKDSVENASTESIAPKLERTGRFLMKVATFAYNDKKTKKRKTSPVLYLSDKKGALMLKINLVVVDGTPEIPKGSYIYTDIPLAPGKGATPEKLTNLARIIKPRLAALTGETTILIESEWIEEWLVPCFNDKNELIKDHKMKKLVMCTVDLQERENKFQYAVVDIKKASETDRSIADPLDNGNQATSAQKISKPSEGEFETGAKTEREGDINPDGAVPGNEIPESSTNDVEVVEPEDF